MDLALVELARELRNEVDVRLVAVRPRAFNVEPVRLGGSFLQESTDQIMP